MKHLFLPDCQVRPGDDLEFLSHIGQYIVEKKPDKVICIGDFADMPSLSSYDVGKKSFEGRRYTLDIQASIAGMQSLLGPMAEYNARARRNKEKQYKPDMHLMYGNHEERILRAIENDSKLEGLISLDDLRYEEFGWITHPFLEPVVLDGICYSHFFSSGVLGRPVTTARLLLVKKFMSCVAGHQQGRDIAYGVRADGSNIIGLIAGSCYEHDEGYLNPQTNNHWRGLYIFHQVNNGSFDEMAVSLDYLRRKYGTKKESVPTVQDSEDIFGISSGD